MTIVFAHDAESEGADRQTLALPGYQDALISAVAAANPRTIVVLNTGGAVLMPWISKVAAVLEAWYPGQEDGKALAPVLFGTVDPSGRLPITFPESDSKTPTSTAADWPGVDDTVSFGNGLDIGYRGYEADDLPTLFAFGYGLSYTRFSLSDLTVKRSGSGEIATSGLRTTGRSEEPTSYRLTWCSPRAPWSHPGSWWPLRGSGWVRGVQPWRLSRSHTQPFKTSTAANWNAAAGTNNWRVVTGSYELLVGESSNDLPLHTELTAP